MKKLMLYFFTDFGPLVAFYAFKFLFDLKVAIALSMVFTVVYVSYRWFKKLEISTFLIFSSVLTLVFGGLDLYSENLFFMKFESAVTSLFFAVFFGLTLFGGRQPIIMDFAERQGRVRPEEIDADLTFFFQVLTCIWVAYFVLKSLLYFYIGHAYSLEQGLAFRVVFGNWKKGPMAKRLKNVLAKITKFFLCV
jgi:intracellular septation protein A